MGVGEWANIAASGAPSGRGVFYTPRKGLMGALFSRPANRHVEGPTSIKDEVAKAPFAAAFVSASEMGEERDSPTPSIFGVLDF